VGHWPAIPRAIRSHEPPPLREPVKQKLYSVVAQPDGSIKREEQIVEIPADVPPIWIENIYHRLFEKILPVKKNMSLYFYDAAIYGYSYAATSQVLDGRKQKYKNLPQESHDRKWHEELAKNDNLLLETCRNRLKDVLSNWDLLEAVDYLNGFAYGIKCQQRESGWSVSAITETLQIYKAILNCQPQMQSLIRQNKSSTEIAEYIADRATLNDGKTTHAQRYLNRKDDSPLSIKRQMDAKSKYLKTFQKICERIDLPLPPPGRPKANRKITTPEN
jgi:hypothetical protein